MDEIEGNLPAIACPKICDCWSKLNDPMWITPDKLFSTVWRDIEKTPLMKGAKVAMCRKTITRQSEHRIMHMSLCDDQHRIDLPLLEDVGQHTVYVQHDYCVACRRFERKRRFIGEPPASPIRWCNCEDPTGGDRWEWDTECGDPW